MRIIHTSDWHLGMMKTQTSGYREDQEHFIAEICEVIDREGARAVLLSGDVYDTGISRAEALALFDRACEMICGQRGCDLVVIAGNHDSGSRLAQHAGLLARSHLHIAGTLGRQVTPVVLDGGAVTVWPLPWFARDEAAAFTADGTVPPTTESAMMTVTDSVRGRMGPGFHILMAHAYVVGAPLGLSDRAAQVGLSDAVSRDVFAGFGYVALGHIHRHYAVPGTDDRVVYCGSPMHFAFDEEGQEKGCMLIDTEEGTSRFVRFTPLHGRKTVTGTLAEVTDPAAVSAAAGCYTRVFVTDREKSLPLRSELLALYPDMLQLQGAQHEGEGGAALTVAELEQLGDIPLMKRFLSEQYALEPDERQVRRFEKALQKVMNGGDRA
ncbi:MAG: exonuclease SbcCD subunit D [Clostridia bacterium]|nr:exonuclease SbcCD subunit D [Clostridia bacterium]